MIAEGPGEKQRFLETLSLVLQGPLLGANQAIVAETCRQWRGVLPVNRIILAVSESDLIRLDEVGVVGPGSRRTGAADPLDLIREACDEIVFALPAKPLPPVKKGLGRNNVNLQIAAAKAGLARVTSEHVLRVRNDLAFRDDAFIDHYLARRQLPRGSEAILGQRVLISPYFTLDPFTLERLPFHYSDWFHLGRTEDVGALWNIAPMQQRNATYYRRHRMRRESNARERLFRSRWATEQYVVIQALAGIGRPVRLDYHDDPADAAVSLRILVDNFVIADFADTPIRFEKYRHLATAPDIGLVCMSDGDMQAIALDGGRSEPEMLFPKKMAAARALLAAEAARRRSPLRRLLDRVGS